MKAIYKREVSSYFNSMIGWIFVAVLTVFIGIYFFAYNLFSGIPLFLPLSGLLSLHFHGGGPPFSPCAPWRMSATPRRTSCC